MHPVFSTASWCFPKPLRGFCITPTQTGTGFKLQPDGGLMPLFLSKGIKGAIWQRGGKWSCGSLNGPEISAQRRNCNCEVVRACENDGYQTEVSWSVKSKTNNLSQARCWTWSASVYVQYLPTNLAFLFKSLIHCWGSITPGLVWRDALMRLCMLWKPACLFRFLSCTAENLESLCFVCVYFKEEKKIRLGHSLVFKSSV